MISYPSSLDDAFATNVSVTMYTGARPREPRSQGARRGRDHGRMAMDGRAGYRLGLHRGAESVETNGGS